nr:acetyl-CoA acetyltransferase, cytosolic 1-like [Tanacetum cinerariifolium]
QKRNVKGKIKVAYKKGFHTRKETTDEVSDPVKLNECKITSPTFVHYNELYRGITVGDNELQGSYATMLAAQSIQLGINDVVMAGGMESMSNVPKYIADARQDTLVDGMVKDGLWDAFNDFKMGNCGEICVDMR